MSIKDFFSNKIKKDLTKGSITSGVLALALPMMVASGLHTTHNLVDIFWVGKLGPGSIASVAMSGTILMVLLTFLIGISTATIALVSRAMGSRDRDSANLIAMQSLFFALLASAICALLGFIFAGPLLKMLGATPEVLNEGTAYLRILFVGGVTMFLLFLGSSVLRGAGDAITPMLVMGLATILNIILDPLLIFGVGFLPRLEVRGAACATVLAQGLAMIVMLSILFNGKSRIHIKLSEFRIDWGIIWRIIRIGVPSSLQMFFRSMAMLALMVIVASFGTYAVAAYGVGIRLRMITLMPAFAFGTAAATLMGQNLGAKDIKRAARSAWTSTGFDFIVMALTGIIFFVFSKEIISLFNKNSEVIALGSNFLKITSLFYIFAAFSIVLSRALNGAGDTTSPMLITFIALWGIQIPLALFFSRVGGLGIEGVWWAIVAATVLNGLLITIWFQSGKWKRLKVAVIRPVP